jgi:hypothetical protein
MFLKSTLNSSIDSLRKSAHEYLIEVLAYFFASFILGAMLLWLAVWAGERHEWQATAVSYVLGIPAACILFITCFMSMLIWCWLRSYRIALHDASEYERNSELYLARFKDVFGPIPWGAVRNTKVLEASRTSVTSVNQLGCFISAARTCAYDMFNNASYVQEELSSLELSELYSKDILGVCAALVGTKHDIINELQELVELNALGDSPVVQGRVERIVTWLSEVLPKLDHLVRSLETETRIEPKYGSAYILVAESTTNILKSYAKVAEAAETYRLSLKLKKGS